MNRWTRRQVILCGTCLIVSSIKESQTGKMHILPLIGGKVGHGSNHVVYLSPWAVISLKKRPVIIIIAPDEATSAVLKRVSLQRRWSVYTASIILPAWFVLAQGHTGTARAKSFIVKEFSATFWNFHIWGQDTLEPSRILKRDTGGHFLFHVFVTTHFCSVIVSRSFLTHNLIALNRTHFLNTTHDLQSSMQGP